MLPLISAMLRVGNLFIHQTPAAVSTQPAKAAASAIAAQPTIERFFQFLSGLKFPPLSQKNV